MINDIINAIKNTKSIYLLTHQNPDGDALGSCFALKFALEKLGIKVSVISEYNLLSCLRFTNWDIVSYNSGILPNDVVVLLDSGDRDRLGKCANLFNSAKTKIVIDHHITNSGFGDYFLIDAHASSTGEIIYHIIKEMNITIDSEIAEALYISIYTDTGGFKHSNVTANTLRIVAELFEIGIDTIKINRQLDAIPLSALALQKECLTTLEILADGKIAIARLTCSMLESIGATDEDSDGLVDIIRSIQNVEVGVLLKEKAKNEVKVSLRSNEYFNVSKISSLFGGGGHIKAAGCTVFADINVVRTQIVDEIMKYI